MRDHYKKEQWVRVQYEKKSDEGRVEGRVDHERKSDGVRVDHEKKSDGVRFDNEKKRVES